MCIRAHQLRPFHAANPFNYNGEMRRTGAMFRGNSDVKRHEWANRGLDPCFPSRAPPLNSKVGQTLGSRSFLPVVMLFFCFVLFFIFWPTWSILENDKKICWKLHALPATKVSNKPGVIWVADDGKGIRITAGSTSRPRNLVWPLTRLKLSGRERAGISPATTTIIQLPYLFVITIQI